MTNGYITNAHLLEKLHYFSKIVCIFISIVILAHILLYILLLKFNNI